MSKTHIALLRGINVGGRNKIKMAELRALFEAAGCTSVKTYIQSGNVAFRATDAVIADVSAAVELALATALGNTIPVLVVPLARWREVLATHPLEADGVDPKRLHVGLLRDVPGADQVAALDPARSPPDRFIVARDVIYLHYPNGVARSKLTNAYLDRTLNTVSTIRGWRTAQKLLALAESIAESS